MSLNCTDYLNQHTFYTIIFKVIWLEMELKKIKTVNEIHVGVNYYNVRNNVMSIIEKTQDRMGD